VIWSTQHKSENTSLDCQSFLALQTNGLRLTFRAAGDFMISPPLIRGYAALAMIADRGKKLRVGSGQVR